MLIILLDLFDLMLSLICLDLPVLVLDLLKWSSLLESRVNLAVVVIDLVNEFLFLENPAHLPLDFPDTDLGVIMVH